MSKSRNNHYVPQWYQKRFLLQKGAKLCRLDLSPEIKSLPDGRMIVFNQIKWNFPSTYFYEFDLYTTIFGSYINDEVETKLFGTVDDSGSRAVAAFVQDDVSEWHEHFQDFFSYIDIQKIRTPKGLEWIKSHYPQLSQMELMIEMQAITNMNCVIWTEGVREIVSAKNSETKFIVSDHPVTVYNHFFDLDSEECIYPNDPSIALKGSQTIFALDKDHCLILTNYEYAKEPDTENPTENRTHARRYRTSMVRTDAFIKTRELTEDDVRKINFIVKKRAKRYIAAAKEDWLYPEKYIQQEWKSFKELLLPPSDELFHFGGETYVGSKDGTTHYQDAFGRTQPENKYLRKVPLDPPPKPGELCGCGSGWKFKKCCMNKPAAERPYWTELSIRERNINFMRGVENILGAHQGKNWLDIRKELSDKQVKEIYQGFGFFWPLATDLYGLLPKRDNRVRALYTGVIDPRLTADLIYGLSPYFDEIIVQNPMINPWRIRPEYNPIENPHQYKGQVLSNVLLLLQLSPLIYAGYVNFIPDPCAFDGHMWMQMLEMAKERVGNLSISEQDKRLLDWMKRDDIRRDMSMMPPDVQRSQMMKALPDLTEDQIKTLLEYSEEQKVADPMALLQDDVFSKEAGGQLSMANMIPNFEMSMLIAQITGSMLLTDMEFRWREMIAAQRKVNGRVIHNWAALSDEIGNLPVILNAIFKTSLDLKHSEQFDKLRASLRDILKNVQETPNPTVGLVKALKDGFLRNYERAYSLSRKAGGEQFVVHLKSIMPLGGIVHNNVQRILLSSGASGFCRTVPIAIFINRTNDGLQ